NVVPVRCKPWRCTRWRSWLSTIAATTLPLSSRRARSCESASQAAEGLVRPSPGRLGSAAGGDGSGAVGLLLIPEGEAAIRAAAALAADRQQRVALDGTVQAVIVMEGDVAEVVDGDQLRTAQAPARQGARRHGAVGVGLGDQVVPRVVAVVYGLAAVIHLRLGAMQGVER